MMTLFQMAKVYYLQNKTEQAWETLVKCDTIQPGHPEVDSFKTVVALGHAEQNEQRQWLSTMAPHMFEHLKRDPANASMIQLMFEVQFALEDKDGLQHVISLADWNQLKRDPSFMGGLADMLRLLDQKGWRSISAQMLTTLTVSPP